MAAAQHLQKAKTSMVNTGAGVSSQILVIALHLGEIIPAANDNPFVLPL